MTLTDDIVICDHNSGNISKTVRSLCGAVSFCVTKGYVCGDRCYVIAMTRTAPQQSDGFADEWSLGRQSRQRDKT